VRRACKAILEPLSDYLEGQAGEEVCRRIEEHLKGCKRCQMHVDMMKVIVTLYKTWRDVDIPDALSVRLQRIIADEIAKTSKRQKSKSRRRRR